MPRQGCSGCGAVWQATRPQKHKLIGTIVNADPIWVVGHKKAGYEINAKLCSFSSPRCLCVCGCLCACVSPVGGKHCSSLLLRATSKAFQFNWQLMLLWSSGLPNGAASRASLPRHTIHIHPAHPSIWAASSGGSLVFPGECLTCPGYLQSSGSHGSSFSSSFTSN